LQDSLNYFSKDGDKKQEMGKYKSEWCQKWQYLQWKCNEN
jgi:hypothetical protein